MLFIYAIRYCLNKHCFLLSKSDLLGEIPKTLIRKDVYMNRNKSFIVRMTNKEITSLDKKVKRTKMSREQYVRTLCNNKIPVEIPPADYYSLIREVRALGNSMNQIAYKANSMGLLDAPLYRHNADLIIETADKLATVCLPKDFI